MGAKFKLAILSVVSVTAFIIGIIAWQYTKILQDPTDPRPAKIIFVAAVTLMVVGGLGIAVKAILGISVLVNGHPRDREMRQIHEA